MNARTMQMTAVLLGAAFLGVAWDFAIQSFGQRYGDFLNPAKLPLLVPMGMPVLLVALASWKLRFEFGNALKLSIAASILGFAGAILGLALRCWFATCEI